MSAIGTIISAAIQDLNAAVVSDVQFVEGIAGSLLGASDVGLVQLGTDLEDLCQIATGQKPLSDLPVLIQANLSSLVAALDSGMQSHCPSVTINGVECDWADNHQDATHIIKYLGTAIGQNPGGVLQACEGVFASVALDRTSLGQQRYGIDANTICVIVLVIISLPVLGIPGIVAAVLVATGVINLDPGKTPAVGTGVIGGGGTTTPVGGAAVATTTDYLPILIVAGLVYWFVLRTPAKAKAKE